MEKDVINILIVDDEKYEGILMEKSVAWESEGFHIMGNVQCAEDALALMEKQTPDIVYTDINMPRIDGLELSRRIRETYPAVHIVIVTGYREFEYAREAIHIGVEEFLLKPIQSDELLAAGTDPEGTGTAGERCGNLSGSLPGTASKDRHRVY